MRVFSRTMLAMTALFFLLSAPREPSDAAAAGRKRESAAVNCRIQQQACTQALSGSTVTLDIFPKPVKAMTDLIFRVRLPGLPPAVVPRIDLDMPGMKMGPNRVKLKASGPDTYEGRGLIVRCPSGSTRWRALVTIPGKDAAAFIFDVVY